MAETPTSHSTGGDSIEAPGLAALHALVRLLARQAARESIAAAQRAIQPNSPLEPPDA